MARFARSPARRAAACRSRVVCPAGHRDAVDHQAERVARELPGPRTWSCRRARRSLSVEGRHGRPIDGEERLIRVVDGRGLRPQALKAIVVDKPVVQRASTIPRTFPPCLDREKAGVSGSASLISARQHRPPRCHVLSSPAAAPAEAATSRSRPRWKPPVRPEA